MAEVLPEYTGTECTWYDIPCHTSGFADWLATYILWVPRKVFELIMESLQLAITGLPMPEWVSGASTSLSALPPGVVFFVEFLQLPAGLAIILSAYGIRFLIRRLPIIG